MRFKLSSFLEQLSSPENDVLEPSHLESSETASATFGGIQAFKFQLRDSALTSIRKKNIELLSGTARGMKLTASLSETLKFPSNWKLFASTLSM